MHKVQDAPPVLDEAELVVLKEFVDIIERQSFSPPLIVLTERIRRMVEGTLVVPISVSGTTPSLSLALLMDHKTEQLYKQTACRVRVAQCPVADKQKGMYLWGGSNWTVLR